MTPRSLSPESRDCFDGLPDYLVLDLADLVKDFQNKWASMLYVNRDVPMSIVPNVDKVIRLVVNSIRQEADAELDLASMAYHDVAALAHYAIDDQGNIEQYSQIHLQLSNMTVHFGKSVIARFKQDSVYHRGYLPYKFNRWVGSTVALGLDRPDVNTQIHYE